MQESKSGRECASIFHSAMFECLEETFIGQKRTVCKLHASCDVILWPRLRKRNKSTSWKQNHSKNFNDSIFKSSCANQFLSKYQLIQSELCVIHMYMLWKIMIKECIYIQRIKSMIPIISTRFCICYGIFHDVLYFMKLKWPCRNLISTRPKGSDQNNKRFD